MLSKLKSQIKRINWGRSLNRAIRTFVQASVGSLATTFSGATSAVGVPDRGAVKKILISAMFAGAAAVASLIHNATEDAAPEMSTRVEDHQGGNYQ
jgi:hypothetical protein